MERENRKKDNPIKNTVDTTEDKSRFDLLYRVLRISDESLKSTARLESAIDKISKTSAVDAHVPAAVAEKAEAAGVTKSKLNTLSTILLGILAGVFIGFGAVLSTVVTTNTGLGFGMVKLLGGLTFCLGLILVVVAGAELFTGNNLIIMGWMSGRVKLSQLLRNWGLVYTANLIGALSLVGLMFWSNQWTFNNYGVGANALAIANAKVNLSFGTALVRGILCNALVCLAVWLCFSARTVTDKIMAIIFPITAFVAAGFEHSIANMYFIPMGMLLSKEAAVLGAAGLTAEGVANLNWAGFFSNLIPVTIGNIIGGGIMVGGVYWVSYLRNSRGAELGAARPWVKSIFPSMCRVPTEEKNPVSVMEPVSVQIDNIIRKKLAEPDFLDNGGKSLLAVLAKARDDSSFLARLAENPAEALKDFKNLTAEEKAAISSGDIKWIESKLGTLDDPLRTWLTARLSQEKW